MLPSRLELSFLQHFDMEEHALWVNAGKSYKSASFMMKQENQGDLK